MLSGFREAGLEKQETSVGKWRRLVQLRSHWVTMQ